MTNFPPSLSRVPPRKSAHQRKWLEKENNRKAVETAMKSLPLKPSAESEIPKMSGLFEQAFHAAVNKTDAATTRMMEGELNALAKALRRSADLVNSLHPDTLKVWAAGADPAANGAALLLVLREAEGWTEDSIATLKRGTRIGGPGRTEDLKAKWIKETAAFVYERLTPRKANIAWDAYASRKAETPFQSFLDRIFEIYGVKASAKSRARKRRSMAKK